MRRVHEPLPPPWLPRAYTSGALGEIYIAILRCGVNRLQPGCDQGPGLIDCLIECPNHERSSGPPLLQNTPGETPKEPDELRFAAELSRSFASSVNVDA